MPQQSGIEAAIRELEAEQEKLSEAISLLRRVRPGTTANHSTRRRRMSAEARKRISEAAKKRWAALRGKKARPAKA